MESRPEYAVFCGVDVGKDEHYAVALSPQGERLHEGRLAQDEQRLRELFTRLGAYGPVLVVVDQPASIGALPVAVARASGCQVGYLPGLTMRRLADLHAGKAKTDQRDAFVIAEAARALPATLRRVDHDEELLAELDVLVGFDDDLAQESTRLINRIRGLLTGIHPALERAIGPDLDNRAVLALLETYGGPGGLSAAGKSRLLALARRHSPRTAERVVEAVLAALAEQTVSVPGTAAAEKVLPALARALAQVHTERRALGAQIEELLDAHPLAPVLTSMPGVGVRTAARILLEVADIAAFPSPAHLAAYAGLAPVTRRSGKSIHGERSATACNRKLKHALWMAAFCSLSDPTSRTYYQRKRDEKKTHSQAVLCLARRRVNVLYAMLRDRTPYRPPLPAAA